MTLYNLLSDLAVLAILPLVYRAFFVSRTPDLPAYRARLGLALVPAALAADAARVGAWYGFFWLCVFSVVSLCGEDLWALGERAAARLGLAPPRGSRDEHPAGGGPRSLP